VNVKGFTLIEILISIAIMMVMISIGITVFYSSKKAATLTASSDGVISTLEQARSNALSGKDGSDYGVRFSTSTYTFFTGDTYNSSDSSNIIYQTNAGTTITSSLGGSGNTVVFYRLTGLPSATGTVTVSQQSPSKSHVITIGSQGNVTIQQQ
jgi:Tfp pilus assembly protein FimT